MARVWGLGRFVTFLFAAVLGASPCSAADRAAGERALMDGRVDEAIGILNSVTAANPKDGTAHLLLCRAFYSEEVIDQALSECEAAVANAGGSSEVHDWMGRVYGAKAGRVGKLAAFSLARKVRAEFERAVALDGSNAAATSDLSEFYVGAPGIVGGGTDKAQALADKVQGSLPQVAHRIRALIADKDKKYDVAEREFKAAVAVGNKPDALIDLAAFYQRRGRSDEAVATVRKVVELDKAKDGSLLDVATILEELHRETPDAIRAVKAYLASNAKSDAAPACKAHWVLGNLLARTVDKPGARPEELAAARATAKAAAKAEYQASLALASRYEPARKALDAEGR